MENRVAYKNNVYNLNKIGENIFLTPLPYMEICDFRSISKYEERKTILTPAPICGPANLNGGKPCTRYSLDVKKTQQTILN